MHPLVLGIDIRTGIDQNVSLFPSCRIVLLVFCTIYYEFLFILFNSVGLSAFKQILENIISHYSVVKSNMAAMLHKRQDTIFVNEPNGDVYEYDTVSNPRFLLEASRSYPLESINHKVDHSRSTRFHHHGVARWRIPPRTIENEEESSTIGVSQGRHAERWRMNIPRLTPRQVPRTSFSTCSVPASTCTKPVFVLSSSGGRRLRLGGYASSR